MSQYRRKILWTVSALFLLHFGLRILHIDTPELRGDEAFSYLITRQPPRQIISAVIAQGDPHPPLHYLTLHYWTGEFGISELSMRLIAVLLSLPWLAVLYRFGQRLSGARFGLLLMGLTAAFQGMVHIGQDVRSQYALVILISTLGTFKLWRISQTAVAQRRDWAVYATCVLLLLYTHYYTLFILLAHGVYMLLPRQRRHIPGYTIANLGALLLFSPWLVATWRIVQRQPYQEPGVPPLLPYLYDVFGWLLVGTASDISALRLSLLVLFAFAPIGAWALYRQERDLAILLMAWLLMATGGMYVMLAVRALFNPFHGAVVVLPWFVLLAIGVSTLWQQRRPFFRVLGGTGLALAVTSAVLPLLLNFTQPYRYGRATGMRGLVPYLEERIAPDDVLLAHFPDPAIDYYFGGLPLERTLLPKRWGAPKTETEAALEQLTQTHNRIWFIPQHHSQWDPEDVVPVWLDYNAMLEQHAAVPRFELLAYRPPRSARIVAISTTELLREGGREILRLDGVHVTVDGRIVPLTEQPLRLQNGDLLQVSLLWTAVSPTSTDYTVFVHLLDGGGTLVAQQDGAPTFGAKRTSLWQRGDVVIDRRDIVIGKLPPGNYRLDVGMYDAITIERQHFGDSDVAWQIDIALGE